MKINAGQLQSISKDLIELERNVKTIMFCSSILEKAIKESDKPIVENPSMPGHCFVKQLIEAVNRL